MLLKLDAVTDCDSNRESIFFNFSKLNQRNSGKASIMGEATLFLKDVFEQIESLRKEHFFSLCI